MSDYKSKIVNNEGFLDQSKFLYELIHAFHMNTAHDYDGLESPTDYVTYGAAVLRKIDILKEKVDAHKYEAKKALEELESYKSRPMPDNDVLIMNPHRLMEYFGLNPDEDMRAFLESALEEVQLKTTDPRHMIIFASRLLYETHHTLSVDLEEREHQYKKATEKLAQFKEIIKS